MLHDTFGPPPLNHFWVRMLRCDDLIEDGVSIGGPKARYFAPLIWLDHAGNPDDLYADGEKLDLTKVSACIIEHGGRLITELANLEVRGRKGQSGVIPHFSVEISKARIMCEKRSWADPVIPAYDPAKHGPMLTRDERAEERASIVSAVADSDPTADDGRGNLFCFYCKGDYAAGFEHADTCAWLRARKILSMEG